MEPGAPAPRGADRHRAQGVLADRHHHRDGEAAAAKQGPAAEGDSDRSDAFTLEDLGYDPQKPASKYALRLEPTLQAVDGQTLGYPWTGVVENWHARPSPASATATACGNRPGAACLPFYARNFATVRSGPRRRAAAS